MAKKKKVAALKKKKKKTAKRSAVAKKSTARSKARPDSKAKSKAKSKASSKANGSKVKTRAPRKESPWDNAVKKTASKQPTSENTSSNSKQYAFEIASREDLASMLVEAGKPLTHDQLAKILDFQKGDDKHDALGRRLGAMVRDGQLVRNRRGGFLPVDESDLIRGRVSAHADGFGFLINETGGEDVYLSAKQMRTVLDGDKVVVQITGTDRRNRSEGAVIEVLERAVKTVVGRLKINHGVAVLVPDNPKLGREIIIDKTAKASDGQIVLAEIVQQPTFSQPAIASVIDVLGDHLAPGMEIDIAIRSRDIPNEWPADVLSASSKFGSTIDKAAAKAKDRRDLRDMPLVTIDGEDARDFDDAVYAEEKLDGGFKLVVAIADVSHYVESDKALDKEAYNRGTSVYFPQRVVPMLPESLSNGLCSLNPDVERLCMVCEMGLDDKGKLTGSKFYTATMRSHARLTYTQVHNYLTSRDSKKVSDAQYDAIKKVGDLSKHIDVLHKLYTLMRVARSGRGAIEFESTETRIVFNDDKKIEKLLPVVRNDAHMVIEECMIAANISAAQFLGKRKVLGLYRSHEGPSADKLVELRKFLALRGLELGGGDTPSPKDYATTLESADGRTDKLVVQTVLLRSMNQAVYSTGNAGHFGLALEEYAHFTSPIRRYPDLMVHRAIKHVLKHNESDNFPYSQNRMTEIADHCSTTERRAEEASRDVISWLKCEYIQDHIGSAYKGVVTGVTTFGLFVELSDVHVEGLVHITSLPQDYYDFESASYKLIGRRGGLTYGLGQVISVVVAAVNLDERKVDFAIEGVDNIDTGRNRPDNRSGKPKRDGQRKNKKDKKEKRGKRKSETKKDIKAESFDHERADKARANKAKADKAREEQENAGGAQSEKSAGENNQSRDSKSKKPLAKKSKAKKKSKVKIRTKHKKKSKKSKKKAAALKKIEAKEKRRGKKKKPKNKKKKRTGKQSRASRKKGKG